MGLHAGAGREELNRPSNRAKLGLSHSQIMMLMCWASGKGSRFCFDFAHSWISWVGERQITCGSYILSVPSSNKLQKTASIEPRARNADHCLYYSERPQGIISSEGSRHRPWFCRNPARLIVSPRFGRTLVARSEEGF